MENFLPPNKMTFKLSDDAIIGRVKIQINKLESLLENIKKKGINNNEQYLFYEGIIKSLYSVVLLDKMLHDLREEYHTLQLILETFRESNSKMKQKLSELMPNYDVSIDLTIEKYQAAIRNSLLIDKEMRS